MQYRDPIYQKKTIRGDTLYLRKKVSSKKFNFEMGQLLQNNNLVHVSLDDDIFRLKSIL